MDHLKKIISEFTYNKRDVYNDQTYRQIKEIISNRLINIMDSKITYATKPRTNIIKFVNALYDFLDQSLKFKNLKTYFGISPSSFSSYLKLCAEYKIFDNLHCDILSNAINYVFFALC